MARFHNVIKTPAISLALFGVLHVTAGCVHGDPSWYFEGPKIVADLVPIAKPDARVFIREVGCIVKPHMASRSTRPGPCLSTELQRGSDGLYRGILHEIQWHREQALEVLVVNPTGSQCVIAFPRELQMEGPAWTFELRTSGAWHSCADSMADRKDTTFGRFPDKVPLK